MICFADHEGRCLLTADAAGIDGTAIEGVELPSEYDPESGQPWTRDRVELPRHRPGRPPAALRALSHPLGRLAG